MLGNPLRGEPGRGEVPSGLPMQPSASRGRQILVDRPADQLVTERKARAAISEDARTPSGFDRPDERGRSEAAHKRQLGEVEHGSEDRGHS